METIGTNIFQLTNFSHEEGKVIASLTINSDSQIFTGHFPDHPLVPGASMLQMVKDLLEKAFNKSLRLKKATNLKFISMITPEMEDLSADISYKLIEEEISATASLSTEGKVCFKLQGVFISLNSNF